MTVWAVFLLSLVSKAVEPHATVTWMLPVIGEGANTCIHFPVKLGQMASPHLISTKTHFIKARTVAPSHYGNRWPSQKESMCVSRMSIVVKPCCWWRWETCSVCPSDGLRHRGQAELGPRGLELCTAALILYRRGPGRHRGIPTGALAGGSACARVLVPSGKHGAADAFLPQCQDHRLAWP